MKTTEGINPLAIAALLRTRRFRFDTEIELQDRIHSVLHEHYPVQREVSLGPQDRIDFLVGGVGIEVKINSPANAVLRQLHRYAQHERITGLVLVTNRARHLRIPEDLSGKLIEIVFTEAAL